LFTGQASRQITNSRKAQTHKHKQQKHNKEDTHAANKNTNERKLKYLLHIIILTKNIKSKCDGLPSENIKINTHQTARSVALGAGTDSEGWTGMKQTNSQSFRVGTRKPILSMKRREGGKI